MCLCVCVCVCVCLCVCLWVCLWVCVCGCSRGKESDAQSRVPFSRRSLNYKSFFLRVSAGFHHVANEPVPSLVAEDCQRLGLSLPSTNMRVPLPRPPLFYHWPWCLAPLEAKREEK